MLYLVYFRVDNLVCDLFINHLQLNNNILIIFILFYNLKF